MTFIIIQYLKN